MTGIDLDAIRARARVIDPCLLDDVPLTLAESTAIAYAPHDIDALCDDVERLRATVAADSDTIQDLTEGLEDLRAAISVRDDASRVIGGRMRAAEAAIAAVRALHQPVVRYGITTCTACALGQHDDPYPCPTIRALDGESRGLALDEARADITAVRALADDLDREGAPHVASDGLPSVAVADSRDIARRIRAALDGEVTDD